MKPRIYKSGWMWCLEYKNIHIYTSTWEKTMGYYLRGLHLVKCTIPTSLYDTIKDEAFLGHWGMVKTLSI